MVSVKRSISDIRLDKHFSISSPDLLKTVIIREKFKESSERSNVS